MSDDSPGRLSTGDWRVILTRTWHAFRISQAYDIASTP
jgi:membrane protein